MALWNTDEVLSALPDALMHNYRGKFGGGDVGFPNSKGGFLDLEKDNSPSREIKTVKNTIVIFKDCKFFNCQMHF